MPVDHRERAFEAAIEHHLLTTSGYALGDPTAFDRERAIQRDVLVREHGLSDRQALALAHVMEHDGMTIQEYEALCEGVNRRTLQRDLKGMVQKGLIEERGTSPTDPTKRYVPVPGVLS